MKKRGFTLLELLIVIVIIGVLAVVALTQYRNLAERARTAEAKEAIAALRTAELARLSDTGAFTITMADLQQYIQTPPVACALTHWFSYALGATCPPGGTAPCFEITANRCAAGGKNPPIPAADVYTVVFREDAAGIQERTGTGIGATW